MTAILLIEDDDGVRESLARALSVVLDATVDAVSTIAAAQEILDVSRHEVVISDHELPDGSGRAFAASLKTAHPQLTVALMSGSFTARAARRIREQDGLDGCLVKGVALVDAIEALLAERAGY